MCGISGFFGNEIIDNTKIKKTLNLMRLRGPDNQSSKYLRTKKKNLYFLHSRLSIIDLKDRSNQPFESDNNHNI